MKYYCQDPELHFDTCDDTRIDAFLDSKTLIVSDKTVTARQYANSVSSEIQNTLVDCTYENGSQELDQKCNIEIKKILILCDDHHLAVCDMPQLEQFKNRSKGIPPQDLDVESPLEPTVTVVDI